MNEQNDVLHYATKLENILRQYLNCGYNDFGVKANGKLADKDWRSSINFALGCRYGSSNQDPKVKEDIDYFLGNELEGQSIGDIVEQYEYYGFDTKEAAFEYIDKTIERLREILYS